jgi:LacI family transcriptional regulator
MDRSSRRRRGSITIEDVARAAGVSAMTVSRVINDGRNVRDGTRERVQDAIAKLNYSPNSAARSLAAGDATHIGLLYSNPSAAYLSQFLVGALETARGAGCHLVIEPCESDGEDSQRQAARSFTNADVEGVILPPPLSESVAIMSELADANVPVVTVAMGRVENALNVCMDDRGAARQMTEYLIGLGHRRIAMIKGHPDQIASAQREHGFREAAEAAGLAKGDIHLEQGYFTFRSGLDAAERLLDLPLPPTAVFASNDDMAAAVISVAHRRGLSLPHDLSVVGFDDTSQATTVWPELTTIRQPVAAMAGAALDLLLAELRARRRGTTVGPAERVLDHELVIRESAVPPAA